MDAKIYKNEKGQAVIEFVLFVPFLLMLYFSILSMSNAINGSINQQKITRAYFYYRASNNSTMPKPIRAGGGVGPSEGWNTFGMQIMGWAKSFKNGVQPIAPCYKFIFPIEGEKESCENAYSEPTTQFIRVQTVYGICGATYIKDPEKNDMNMRLPEGASANQVVSSSACLITN